MSSEGLFLCLYLNIIMRLLLVAPIQYVELGTSFYQASLSH
jgi:hypothetical protein